MCCAASTGCIPDRCRIFRRCIEYADTSALRDGYFHVELMSIRRSAAALKYLAASESAMDAFISDVMPEAVAERLRSLA